MSDLKPIAIVGISAELPSGSYSDKNLDYHTFSDFLLNKGQSYETVPKDRFNNERWHGLGLGHTVSQKGSFLKDVPLFDHIEFGISAKDAKNMSLSTRKLIEHSFLALLDSGINYRGRNIGCYMSATSFDMQSVSEPDELEANGSFAGYANSVANKVSYHLDLRGPSIPVDTACSSSLTALHLAVQAIRAGDCDAAILGGCQLNFRFIDFIQYSQGSVLSADGICKPLDESANGFSRGEGVTVVVVKPLDRAIQDNDHIYATILGTGINSSGSLAPVSAPVASAQKEAMERAFTNISRTTAEVDYVELHATGTAAGDPTEANWVGEVFGQRHSELLVGSVKGNIGHLEICAFLASLCKICAMFQTRLLPPTVNLSNPNPAIAWNRWNMRAPTEITSIMGGKSQLLVSIASSGIGGSNGHAVVESFPEQASPKSQLQHERPLLILAGGLSPRSTSEISNSIDASWSTTATEDLPIIASASSRRGRQMPWQTFAIMSKRAAIVPFMKPTLLPKSTPPLAFVFCGQGPQYIHMGSQLFESYPKFRNSILEMDIIYERVVGHSLRSLGLFSAGSAENWNIWPISTTLPAIAMVQMAMFDLLSSINIVPTIVVGHSAGETAMMYASGACSRDMALEISIARGTALATLEELGGSMVALNCGPDQAQLIIDEVMANRSGILQIACYNSDFAVTLAGAEPLLDFVVTLAKSRDISAHKLRTKIAVHSEFVEQCKVIYHRQVEDIFVRYPGDHVPSVITYSSTFGKRWAQSFTSDYYWQNVRQPVLFSQAIKTITKDFSGVAFVEVSPHPVLSTYISDSGVELDHVLCFMKRAKVPLPFSEPMTFLQGVANLSLIGYTEIDFHSLNDTRPSAKDGSVSYPFLRKYIPFCPESPKTTLFSRSSEWSGPLLHTGLRLNALTHPKLAEHVIMGEPILPATGFLEMVFESGAKLAWNIQFQSMLPLLSERFLPVNFTVNGPAWSVSSELPSQSGLSKQRIHARGFMASDAVLGTSRISISDLKKSLQALDISQFYEILAHFGQYGPIYQRVTACWKTNGEALVEIRAYDKDLEDLDKYVIHPALLDACFHAIVHPMFTANADRSVYYLPMSIETVALYDPWFIRKTLPKVVYSHISYKSWDPAGMTFDVSVADANGTILCQLSDVRIAQHKKTANAPNFENQAQFDGRFDIIYQPLLASTSYTFSGSGVLSSPSLDMAAQPNDALASMEIHDNIGKEIGDSIKRILTFLRIQGNKKVIRLLIIGTELLEIIRATAESELQSLYTLDIHALVKSDLLPASPSLRGIGRILYSPPSDSLAQKERNGTDTSYYDVIMGPSHEEGTDHILERVVQRLLPGGFLILTTRDNNLEGTKLSTSSSHTVSRPNHTFLPSSESSSHQKTADASLTSAELHSSRSISEARVNGQHILPSIIPFHFDNALAMQQTIQQLPDDETLWIESSRNIHGHAAIGFVRSLQKEMVGKDIRLALFDAKWSEEERIAIVSSLSSYPYIEKEIFIDSLGLIRVPRMVPASTLRNSDTTQPNNSPIIGHQVEYPRSSQSSKVSNSQPPLNHVQVHVISSSSEYGRLKAIVGYVLEAGSTRWDSGAQVLGVTSNPISNSNSVVVHEHSLVAFANSEAYNLSMVSQCAMTVFIAALAIGSRLLIQPDALRSLRVVIMHHGSEDTIGRSLNALLTLLDVVVVNASKPMTPQTLDDIRSCNVVFTGWIEPCDMDIINSVLPESATLLSWSIPQVSVSNLLTRNLWMVGDILHVTIGILHKFLGHQQKVNIYPHSRSPIDEGKTEISTNTSLFDASKEYYLLGGLGSLGMRAAKWMYENGARMMVLTSRHGDASALTDEMAIRILSYLQKRPDLRLRLEACDASSELDMSALFRQTDNPIGGCILMSGALEDRLFIAHDNTSYNAPFPGKVGALIALENAVDIHSLDFLVSTSSVATFGNVGQTNYSSANTAVDGLLSKYKNAFSLITPAIIDSVVFSHDLNLLPDPRFKAWLPWSMTSSELFEYLADGIRSMGTHNFSLYVPRLNWYHMKEHFGNSPMYDHLVYEATQNTKEASVAPKELLRAIVRKHLDIDESDFSADIPFTSYGLDSLSAGRLSHSLFPLLRISQLQLLADITLHDLEQRIQKKEDLPLPLQESALDREFNWQSLNQPGQTVVKLVKGEGIPLILIHGGSGNIVPFIPLQQRFNTPLWAIQHTPECPTDSLQAMAAFYFSKIKAARPSGPYRLGGYSACCLLAFEVAYLLRDSGDRVSQLVILDHFPTLFSSPVLTLDDETIRTKKATEEVLKIGMDALLDAYSREPTVSRQKIAEEINRARRGEIVSQFIQSYITFIYQFATISAKFVIELCDLKTADHIDPLEMNRRLREWTMKVDAPLTIVVAENGFFKSVPQPNEQWTDLTWTGGNIVRLPGVAHFNMMETLELVEVLESGWDEKDRKY